MDSDTTNIINRISFYLIDHPWSTAKEIAAATNVSRQKISGVIGMVPNISGETGADNMMRFSIRPGNSVPDAERKEPGTLDAAIQALLIPLTGKIRASIDTELNQIVAHEVGIAMEAVQLRVKSRLAFFLTGGDQECPAARGPDPSREVTDKTAYAATAGVLRKLNEHSKEGAQQQSRPSEIVFTNPAGSPVAVNDPVSKRTSHKTTGLPPAKAQQPGPEAAAPAKPKKPLKIIIVGLHQNKQELIKREFRDKFDLRLFTPDQLTFIKKAINPGDNVICMADYISHAHTETVTARNGVMTVVHGGMPALRDELAERYETFITGAAA